MEILLDQSSTPNTSEQVAPEAPYEEKYDQWQGRRLLFGLFLCTGFVVAAIVFERCG